MASPPRSDPPGRGGLFRGFGRLLLPRRRLLRTPSRRPALAGASTEGMAVRAPWWRLVVRRLVDGLRPRWPSRRAESVRSPEAGLRSDSLLRAEAPLARAARPLARSRRPLARSRRPLIRSRGPLSVAREAVGGRPDPSFVPSDRPKDALVRSPGPVPTTSPARAVAGPRLAERRWREAVAARPLEPTRPFSRRLRPLVARITGSASRASYTTGPATRHALDAAGAAGATSGTVVHLPEEPGTRPDGFHVLAHELAHARHPLARPRFLLHSPSGAQDADERAAHTIGRSVSSAATSSSESGLTVGGGGVNTGSATLDVPNATLGAPPQPLLHTARPTVQRSVSGPALAAVRRPAGEPAQIQRLSFGRFDPGAASRALGGATQRAGSALSGVTGQATFAVGGLTGRASGLIGQAGSAASGLAGQAGSAVSGLAGQASNAVSGVAGQAGGFADRAVGEAGGIAAGIVDRLPVGAAGAGGIVEAATQAARSAVSSALAEATEAAGGATAALTGAAQRGMVTAQGAVGGATGAVTGAVDQATAAGGAALSDAAGQAQTALAGASGAVTGAAAGAGAPAGPDIDRIAEAIEERLLHQLERRGGRYAGVF